MSYRLSSTKLNCQTGSPPFLFLFSTQFIRLKALLDGLFDQQMNDQSLVISLDRMRFTDSGYSSFSLLTECHCSFLEVITSVCGILPPLKSKIFSFGHFRGINP